MTTAIQRKSEPNQIRSLIAGDYFREQVKLCLPKHLTPERFIRMALTACMRTPKLMDCSKESVTKCMLALSELGIEPDGRRAHLIPFENRKMGTVECTLIIDWKGLAELAMRSGVIGKLHADIICENDDFAYDLGDILHHRIDWKQDRGTPYAAYAMAITKDGMRLVQVMTKAEIEKVRDGSQGWKAFKAGWAKQSPWNDAPYEMWKKTAFRRLSKWLPLSPEIHDAVDKDEVQAPVSAIISSEMVPAESTVNESQPAIDIPASQPEKPAEGQAAPDDGDLGPTQQEPAGEAEAPAPVETPKPVAKPVAPKPKPAAPVKPGKSPNVELEEIITAAGFQYPQFQQWVAGMGIVQDMDSYGSFGEMKAEDCTRLLRARSSLIPGLQAWKEEQQ